jgi:hypothetical protein
MISRVPLLKGETLSSPQEFRDSPPRRLGVGRRARRGVQSAFGEQRGNQASLRRLGQRALIPLEDKRVFLEVSGDAVERVDPALFSDPLMACQKALRVV